MYYILDVFSHLPRFFASCFYTCTREIFCLHSGGVNYLITGWSFSPLLRLGRASVYYYESEYHDTRHCEATWHGVGGRAAEGNEEGNLRGADCTYCIISSDCGGRWGMYDEMK
jgi:hypothetical protein